MLSEGQICPSLVQIGLRQDSSKKIWCPTLLTSSFDWLIEFYFWPDVWAFLVLLLQQSTFCWTETTSLFLALLFFHRIEHSFGNSFNFFSLPFLTHILWSLEIKFTCLSLAHVVSVHRIRSIDDFASFSFKFCTDFTSTMVLSQFQTSSIIYCISSSLLTI